MPVSPDTFKQVMSRWPSGVTVVTTRREDGIHGMTASAFSPLSLDPPLVLVCVDKRNRTHDQIPAHGHFGVHFLGEPHEEISDRCAGFHGETGNHLEEASHRSEVTGAPILDDCAAWLDCRLWATYDGGDHTIYVGQVEAAGAGETLPLLWFNRRYHRLLLPSE